MNNKKLSLLLLEAAELLNSTNLVHAKSIAKNINKEVIKYKKGSKVGNQNCLLCTWTAEANFRGINILPRPVYSPRDIIFSLNPLLIIKNPSKILISCKDDIKENLINSGDGSRFYIHVNWKDSSSGHEFLLANISNKLYVIDSQAGKVIELDSAKKYFDINYKNSFMCRLDNKEFNNDALKYNDKKYIIQWDDIKDPKVLETM